MLRTLHGKLSAVLLGILGLLYITVTLYATRTYIQEIDQKLNRDLAHDLAHEKLLLKDGHVYQPALKEVIDMLMVINPNIEVYVLDGRGTILAYSAPPDTVVRQRVGLGPVQRFLHSDALPIWGDDPRGLNSQKVFSAAPVPAYGPPQGYVYVVLGGRQYDSVASMLQSSYIMRLSLWVVAGSFLFVLVAGPLLFQALTRRLRRLTSDVESFERGDYAAPAAFKPSRSARTQDAIDRLGLVFTHMAERIQRQMHDLREADAQRREMISNVSHDLRTPLAALQGYLETMLIKDWELSPAQQREYLTVAIRHSERLSALVAQLFELARLDARDVQVQVEPLPLGELVQDVVQKYQLVAERKHVSLQADFNADLPFVCADIGLIERVLENLLENALRHTPEGSRVAIAPQPDHDSVRVQVRDTGHGIPAEDLPHIFDRLYQALIASTTPWSQESYSESRIEDRSAPRPPAGAGTVALQQAFAGCLNGVAAQPRAKPEARRDGHSRAFKHIGLQRAHRHRRAALAVLVGEGAKLYGNSTKACPRSPKNPKKGKKGHLWQECVLSCKERIDSFKESTLTGRKRTLSCKGRWLCKQERRLSCAKRTLYLAESTLSSALRGLEAMLMDS